MESIHRPMDHNRIELEQKSKHEHFHNGNKKRNGEEKLTTLSG